MSFKNTRRLTKSISPMGDRTITPDGNSKCTYCINRKTPTMIPLANRTYMALYSNNLFRAPQPAPIIIDHDHLLEMMISPTVPCHKSTSNSITIV